jgi:hypothetical protein
LRGALLQAALKLYDPLLQLLDAPALPVQGLEKAVESLPNDVAHLLFHPSEIKSRA